MTLIGLALNNLQRRPMRTSLTTVGIALAVGAVLVLVALSRSLNETARERLDEFGADLTITQRGAPDFFSGFLPEQLEARIAAVPGVARVSGELLMFAQGEGDKHILASGWKETSAAWRSVPIREGRLPDPGERRVVLMGDSVAESMGKRLGDQIDLLGEQFRIIAITGYASVINRGLVIARLADLQDVTYRAGQVTTFQVAVRPDASAAEVDRIRRDIVALGGLSVSTPSEVLDNDRHVKSLHAVSLAITIIALAMGVMNVLNTLMMSIQERTGEIGVMAAIGWSDRLIMSSIVIEGLLMCAVGCAVGIALGYLVSILLFPIVGEYLSFRPTIGLIVPTVAATFVLCAIGSLYPAWRAVRIAPAEALRRA